MEAYKTDMVIPPKGRPVDTDDIEDAFVVFASSGDRTTSELHLPRSLNCTLPYG